MAKYDEENGVWRTIGGRKVFIRNGQSLSDAMKESGKFKSAKKENEKDKTNEYRDFDKKMRENKDRINKEYDDEMSEARRLGREDLEAKAKEKRQRELKKYDDMQKENLDNYKSYKTKEGSPVEDFISKEGINAGGRLREIDSEAEEFFKSLNDSNRSDEEAKLLLHYKYNNSNEDNLLDKYKEWQKQNGTANKETQGKNFRNSLTKLSDKSIEDGTYDLETGKKVDFGNEGYNVSFEQSSDNYSDSEYYDKIEECRKLCDGKVYGGKFGGDPEISFYTKDKDVAMQIMEKYNQHSIYDNSIGDVIENPKYNAETNKVNYESKNDWLPRHTEIKEQGTSNRKEVSDNIQAHILEYYGPDYTGEDIPAEEAFVRQMDAMNWLPNNWKRGEYIAKGGSYLVYNGDMAEFLDSLKINPKGKSFSDDKAFDMYTSLIGRESAKLYDKIKKHQETTSKDWVRKAFEEYKKQHPNTKKKIDDFRK